MEDQARVNPIASLHSTATDLSGVADGLAGLNTDDGMEQQAQILDRIAEDAIQGAAILRAHGLIPRRVRSVAAVHRIPPRPGGGSS